MDHHHHRRSRLMLPRKTWRNFDQTSKRDSNSFGPIEWIVPWLPWKSDRWFHAQRPNLVLPPCLPHVLEVHPSWLSHVLAQRAMVP